jgi:intein/homing endonuclease
VDRFEDLVAYTSLFRPGPIKCCKKDTLILTRRGNKPIEDIARDQDEIAFLSQDGSIKFTKKYIKSEKSIKKLVKITLRNGKSITCSPDHKFLTKDKKYIMAKKLKIKQELCTIPTV